MAAGTAVKAKRQSIGGDVRLDVQGSDIIRAVNLKGGFELKGRGNDVDLEKIAGQVSVDGSWGGLVQMRELWAEASESTASRATRAKEPSP